MLCKDINFLSGMTGLIQLSVTGQTRSSATVVFIKCNISNTYHLPASVLFLNPPAYKKQSVSNNNIEQML